MKCLLQRFLQKNVVVWTKETISFGPTAAGWAQSVPPAVAGGCAALKQFGARLRTHPLPQVVLTPFQGQITPAA